MGNEASQEGGGQPGQPAPTPTRTGAPASGSAPPGSGQQVKPSNGAPTGVRAAGGGPGVKSVPAKKPQPSGGDGGAGAGRQALDKQPPAAKQGAPPTQADKGGKTPSAPDGGGSAPASPYTVPQIAPMPSSNLCPVCKTADLKADSSNTCTQCRQVVCGQCGFNPNPHLTEVQEWLCLNCQMQRALGMDMTTPQSKQLGGLAKAPSQPDLSRSSTNQSGQQDHTRSAGSSPSRQSQEQPLDKLFGFGASILSQASTLMSVDPLLPSQPPPAPTKTRQGPVSGPASGPAPAPGLHAPPQQQPAQRPKELGKLEPNCPLCKAELNVSKFSEPPNYSTCTQCHTRVCNMCGFNPTPHLVEKKEWLCLNCQTQRLMSGGLGDAPLPVPQPSPQQPQPPANQQQASQQKETCQQSEPKPTSQKSEQKPSGTETSGQPDKLKKEPEIQPSPAKPDTSTGTTDGKKEEEAQSLKNDNETKSSTQSLSDTGYSSDGVSSSQSEITGLIQEDANKPPNASEITKPETSAHHCEAKEDDDKKQRPCSLSISNEGHEEQLDGVREEDYKKPQKDTTDEEFMRSKTAEMSVDREDNQMTSQGGLRRFKTIELNNTNTYNSDIELRNNREPELEMETLTGSPDERSRGEYSSTLSATTSSYTSAISPTSVSSMEEDSDSSPSRKQRLEDAKQQRKARHRSHGPLLPTIEDSSEEDELREEEELLREQEMMREVEQQGIRSTARKTKRDKEELRAQRRRERSKTPPSNLSPIEDASPTEELRQAAEMEELHRSSCSEYSPSIDSEAEGFEMMTSKSRKTANEHNLPTFMSLYSPTEKLTSTSPCSADKTPKSAEVAYEEMIRKAETLQKSQGEQLLNNSKEIEKQLLDARLTAAKLLEQNRAPLTPGTSPTQISAPISLPDVHAPSQIANRSISRQQSLQESGSPSKLMTINSSTSPLSSPTRLSRQSTIHSYTPESSSPTSTQRQSLYQSPQHSFSKDRLPNSTGRMEEEMENISLCRLSTVPGTSRVAEQGKIQQSSSIVDLRAPIKPAPLIMTEQGMDLTSVATEIRRYSIGSEGSYSRHSTAVQPLIMNLNTHEHPRVAASTPTTVNVTVAASKFISQPKKPVIYGDPLQNKVDLGQGLGSAVCLTQSKVSPNYASIPKIDACLEDLGIQQQQLQLQQEKLQKQKEKLEQQLQAASFARYNLANQAQPMLLKKDLLVCQTTNPQAPVSRCAISRTSSLPSQTVSSTSHDIYCGIPLELKSKPTAVNLTMGKSHAMMVQLVDSTSQGKTVTQLVKTSELPNQDVLDLTGQIKAETQLACCDVVYNLPFGGSCKGPFSQKVMLEEKMSATDASQTSYSAHALEVSGNLQAEPRQESHQYQEHASVNQNVNEDNKSQPASISGQSVSGPPVSVCEQPELVSGPPVSVSGQPGSEPPVSVSAQPGSICAQPSLSNTDFVEAGLQGDHSKTNPGTDLNTIQKDYVGGYLGVGAQYGSYTDLRQQNNIGQSFPMRRYGSMSSINTDYGYSTIPESSLAQYSATTAREISRMCAALKSMDQVGGRYGNNPEVFQYGSVAGGGPLGRPSLQQGLTSVRASLIYGHNGGHPAQGQVYANLINSNQASLRYPSAVRSADGMIYSTINTPIASTLPITTQPASVLCPTLQGIYRPCTPSSLTSVPLASLTRLPQVTPRMPLSAQGPYRYPPPSRFPSGPCAAANATPQIPIYLGKPSIKPTVPSTMQTAESLPPAQSSQQVTHPASIIVSTQQQSQSHFTMQIAPKIPVQPQTQTQSQIQMQPQTHQNIPRAAQVTTTKTSNPEKEKEEEQLRQKQEQLLQLEREHVELEKLRHLRLQEELERDRMELQRHREKEQLLVQREIQELQSIKQQVLKQQHAERETQLVLQREQLAQQKVQLDQIQSLQQQLQQHLEEQKRQKTADTITPAAATSAQGFSVICPITGNIIQKDLTQPYADGQGLIASRPLPSSTSEMSLKNNEELLESIKKQNSMPRLRDSAEGEDNQLLVKRITDSCVQTDDEEGEERSIISRRRRTRHIVDSSVQTDEEDQDEWEQPVRRRRSRFSKHSSLESSLENKLDTSKVSSLNVAIQTINDSSCQTELELLRGISPSIHITSEPRVEFLHYISAPERNRRGESLACQTEPESQSQGVVVPQVNVSSTVDPLSLRITGTSKFERRKPDPLEIGFQNEPVSSLVRQPPKSPQVLYSPVSPLSPHRLLENSFSSSERLNKAHVPPQKHFSVDSPEHHQPLPHPIKSMQRSLSDPKPISPTSEDPAQAKFSIYQHQALLNKQQNLPTRKVKRTLPSPPPEESSLPIVTPTHNSMFASTNMAQAALSAPKPGLLIDLRVVEQESSKLRKQQAELEEEEKEIDAKLRCLELGITQRKETLIKERERRELAYVRCMGESRDYTPDSELTTQHLRGTPFDNSGSLTRLSTASLNQFTANQLTPGSSFLSYDYQQSQPGPPPQDCPAYQQRGFQPPQYQTVSLGQPQPGTFQPQSSAAVLHQSHIFSQNQASYQTSLLLQQSHTGFQPPPSSASYVSQTHPYSEETGQGISLQPQPKTQHQKPRQTSLADLEQKMPTNYEVISTPTVAVAATALEDIYNSAYSSTTISNTYGQYRPPEQSLSAEIHSPVNPTPAYSSEGHYTNLEQNIPRNYVMIDDINELTKESRDMYRTDRNGGYGNMSHYGRAGENPEDLYDHQGRVRGDYNSHVDGSSYYYDDYRSSSYTHSKNMTPAVMSSKRNKHRKPGMDQISKFSPIEEARDVESDLASYNMATSRGSSNIASRARRLQDDITYGLKKNVYEQQKYYGKSSHDGLEEDNRMYSSGRSRSTGYGMDKIASREYGSYRSKSYEMNIEERSHRGSHRRSQNLDESPMNEAQDPTGSESRDRYSQYGSSHSLPDVQDRTTDLPRSHIYKQDDPNLVDDMNCAVSDSEAYHLGQEETDWFEKPRESRSERSRHHSGSSSTHRRRHSQHEYDEPLEKEPLPQDDYAQPRSSSSASQDHGQQGSSSRRHSTSSRHSCDDLRSSRSSREHTNDPSVHPESRGSPSTAKRRTSDSRSTQDHPSDQSQDPSSHHQGSPGPRRQKQTSSPSSRRHEMQRMASTESKSQSSSPKHRASSGQQPSSQQQEGQQGHGQQKPQSRRGSGAGVEAGAEAQAEAGAGAGTAQHQQSTPSQPPAQALAQVPAQAPAPAQAQTEAPAPIQAPVQAPASAQAPDLASDPAPAEAGAQAQAQAQAQTPESDPTPDLAPVSAPAPAPAQAPASAQAPSQAQQPQSSPRRTPVAKTDPTPDASNPGIKPTGSQPAKSQPVPSTGIGSRAAPNAVGPASAAAAGQPAAEGDNVFSKILPGGAAEQAGKLGDAMSAIGKKFTSFW
ncbi:protein bassoon-like isoform X1 [Paramormyrops kingsleyae]|uniref:protein bassoon-like isoform X1 n=1 Tax=Paramormyrops kingsleyae TaxID=1676925 RepID=UPI003B97B356